MFQPHSVRGLLSRRNQTRLHSQQVLQSLPAGGDSDFDSLVQTKLIIKDVQHKIEDIRQWREHQQSLLEQKLASNQAVAKVTTQQYLSHIGREEQRQHQQRDKILSRLKIEENQHQLHPQQWNNSDTNLFEYLTKSNQMVDYTKYEQDNTPQELPPQHQAFINQLENITTNILRREEKPIQNNTEGNSAANRSMIRKELEEIDNELREIEELMRD